MKANWIWVAAILLVLSPLSYAKRIETPMSALHLYTACKDGETIEYSRGYCEGAIDAMYSSIDEWCVPQSVTHREVKEQVIKELLRSVPRMSYDALAFVKEAIREKWPCRET